MGAITRKKDTGEPGNKGEFGHTAKAGSGLVLSNGVGADADEQSVFRRRFDTMSQKLDAFRAELEQQISELGTDENWKAWLDSTSKFHHYSLGNQLLIALQRPDATRVTSFKKWQALGRSVKKGEKAIQILAPRTVRVPVDESEEKDGKPQVRITGFTTVSVFDISQTEGQDLPTPFRELTEEPPEHLVADLEAAISERGFSISYESLGEYHGGYTSFADHRVVVNESIPPARQAKTLAHELGHIVAGHGERMKEYHEGPGGCRGSMEVEAESIAYAVCRANGMSTQVGDFSSTYIQGWARQAGVEAVRESAESVQKAVKAILSEHEFTHASV